MQKKDIIEVLSTTKSKFNSKNDLIDFLSKKLDQSFEVVKKNVNLCLDEGKIIEVRKGVYKPLQKSPFLKGRIIGNNKGYAFCDVGDKQKGDYFIPARKLNGALNGDVVLIRPLIETDESTEAEVFKILQRDNVTIVGVFKKNKKGDGILLADNKKFSETIFIDKNKTMDAYDDAKVVVKVDFSTPKGKLKGEIIEVLGEENDIDTLQLAIVRDHKLYEIFPAAVLQEAESVETSINQNEIKRRKDLRDEVLFTIDGEDAKDFDDAVSIKKDGENYILGVHIADVGHYVKYNSNLEKEAYIRGTSAYFPDLVLPMLPKNLSNGICSLNPNEDRLALSVYMTINKQGIVKNHQIYESVIKSKARLTYTEVFAVLSGNEKMAEKYREFKDSFFLMAELSDILGLRRQKAGALDLDIKEAFFVLNKDKKVEIVKPRERNAAHKLIENFMVIANEVIAKEFCIKKLPFVYRVHEKPTLEKINDFCYFLKSLGIDTKTTKNPTPLYIQEILNQVKDKPYNEVVNKVLLRSLQKAKYSEDCLGHFGLALDYYCHFTSPIRRYPDLVIHRIIKESLKGEIGYQRRDELTDFVVDASFRSSDREKNADEAERDTDDLYKAYYMQDHLNEEFEGIISGVASYGFYVELENTIEGLVRIENLKESHYTFFEKSFKLKGEATCYSLGDKVKVKAIKSSLFDRKIEFILKD